MPEKNGMQTKQEKGKVKLPGKHQRLERANSWTNAPNEYVKKRLRSLFKQDISMVQVFGETSKKHEKTHLLYIWLRGILQDHILRQRDQHKEGHKKCLGTRYFLNLFCVGYVGYVGYDGYMTTMTWYGSMIPC